jgi:hypothetical protein
MDQPPVGPVPELVSSPAELADLLVLVGPGRLAEAYGPEYARYQPTPRQCLILARRHWDKSEDELWGAYQATAEANERRELRPEPEQHPTTVAPLIARRVHRAGHRGPARRPAARRARRCAKRAGPAEPHLDPAQAGGGR